MLALDAHSLCALSGEKTQNAERKKGGKRNVHKEENVPAQCNYTAVLENHCISNYSYGESTSLPAQ